MIKIYPETIDSNLIKQLQNEFLLQLLQSKGDLREEFNYLLRKINFLQKANNLDVPSYLLLPQNIRSLHAVMLHIEARYILYRLSVINPSYKVATYSIQNCDCFLISIPDYSKRIFLLSVDEAGLMSICITHLLEIPCREIDYDLSVSDLCQRYQIEHFDGIWGQLS